MNADTRDRSEPIPVSVFLRNHLEPSLEMIREDVRLCPDELWTETAAGYPFWQQIYHVLESLDFWLTVKASGGNPDEYSARNFDKDVSAELGEPCREAAAKEELLEYLDDLRGEVDSVLRSADEGDQAAVDALLTQIRHLQYHAGHADAALRSRGIIPGEWKGYGEQ